MSNPGAEHFVKKWSEKAKDAFRLEATKETRSGHEKMAMAKTMDKGEFTLVSGAYLQEGYKIPKDRFGKAMVPLIDLNLREVHLPHLLPSEGRLQVWVSPEEFCGDGNVELKTGTGELEIVYFPKSKGGKIVEGGKIGSGVSAKIVDNVMAFKHHLQPWQTAEISEFQKVISESEALSEKVGMTFDYDETVNSLADSQDAAKWGTTESDSISEDVIVGGWGRFTQSACDEIAENVVLSIPYTYYDGDNYVVVNICVVPEESRRGDFSNTYYEVQA